MSSTRLTEVSVIVPLYFCDVSLYPKIERSLNSVKAELVGFQELVLVDDASPLPLPGHWEPMFSNKENLGFTATVNRGLEYAFSHNTDVAVVMNDDIVMTPQCMDRFKALDPNSLTIASPRDTASDDSDRFGACWGITRDAYELLGPLNEEYRHFYSDREYYERAKEAGVEVVKWDDIVLEHPESSTYGLLDKQTLLSADAERYNKAKGGTS